MDVKKMTTEELFEIKKNLEKKIFTEELEKAFPIEKPEETENTIRIPVGPDCEVTATIKIDPSQGIQALYCGRIKKIRTYIFDKRKKAWTIASAQAWIKEQKKKDAAGAKAQKCSWCEKAATKTYLYDNGNVFMATCDDHRLKTKKEIETRKKSKVTAIKSIAKKKSVGAMFKIVKKDKAQQIVGGIVYEPHEVDTQGDYTDDSEIEKAMYGFMEKYATNTNRIRINHKGKKYFFPILECFQAEEDTVKGGQRLTKGSWWLMIKVKNKSIWEQIEKDKLSGFSMGGQAKA